VLYSTSEGLASCHVSVDAEEYRTSNHRDRSTLFLFPLHKYRKGISPNPQQQAQLVHPEEKYYWDRGHLESPIWLRAGN